MTSENAENGPEIGNPGKITLKIAKVLDDAFGEQAQSNDKFALLPRTEHKEPECAMILPTHAGPVEIDTPSLTQLNCRYGSP